MRDVSATGISSLATWRKWGAVTLFIAWLFYCLGAYYVVQKPFDLQSIVTLIAERDSWLRLVFSTSALVRTLLDIGTAVWLAFIALGIGSLMLDLASIQMRSTLDEVLFSLGTGFGLLGVGGLVLGVLGLLQTAVITGVTILLTLLAAPKALRLIRRFQFRPPSRIVGFYLVITSVMALMVALLPPTSWDGLFYHLKGPKLYLLAGRIQPNIDIPHLSFPSLFEMLFMIAMALRGDVAAKLLHFIFAFMLAGLVFAIARDQLKVRNAWTAVLFLFATPMVLSLAGWAYNDLALAFYQVAALYLLLRWRRQRDQRYLGLSGVMCGLALGLKYTSFVAPVVLLGIVIWEHRGRLSDAARPLVRLGLPTLLVAAPWYIKNLLFTGNPIYPFVFDGQFWDEFRAAAYAGPGTGLGLDLVSLIRLPHDLTLGLKDASQDGPTGPFFLAFLPLLLVYAFSKERRSQSGALSLLLIFALAQFLFWTAGVIFSGGLWQSRLLLPAFVALCPAMAWILQDLSRFTHPQFSLQRFVMLTLGLVLSFGIVSQTLTSLPRAPLAHLIGTDTRSEVLRQLLGLHYVVMEEMNAQLPRDATVTFLWEPRSYYCERDCRPDSILDTFSHLEHLYGDASGIAAAWRRDGITHVLLHQAGLDFVVENGTEWVVPRNIATLEELQEHYLIPIAKWENAYTLYSLRP